MKSIYLSAAFTLATLIQPAFAQQPSGPFLGAPGITDFRATDLLITHNAMRTDDKTVQLTSYAQRQSGSAELPLPVCGQEYVWSYELNAGSNTAFLSGAGFKIFKLHEKSYSNFSADWNEWFPNLTTSSGAANRIGELHFDTFQDWWDENGTTVYQRDGNSVYFWSYDVNSAGSVSKSESLNQAMPFMMETGGWFHVRMHFKQGELRLRVTRNNVTVLDKVLPVEYFPNTPHYLVASAWTGASYNVQAIRNVRFEGITPDNCASPLTLDEVQQSLKEACGEFSAPGSCPEVCVSATLTGLMGAGLIEIDVYDTLARSCQANMCEGSKEASYQTGFGAGVTSMNSELETAYTNGHSACVETMQPQITAAFQEGYDAGVDSTEPKIAEAYSDGHSACMETMEPKVTAAYTNGYNAGVTATEAKIEEAYLKGLQAEKVTLCHLQPKKHSLTLTVGRSAVAAHLKHGDILGACPRSSAPKK